MVRSGLLSPVQQHKTDRSIVDDDVELDGSTAASDRQKLGPLINISAGYSRGREMFGPAFGVF